MLRLRYLPLLALAVGSVSPRASAQTGREVDDAVILVAPMGADQSMVALTFPTVVPRATAAARVRRLAQAGGWRVVSLEVRDREDAVGAGYKGRQTDATAILAGAPQFASGGFRLQPYVETFRDLRRFQVLFVAPPDPGFAGLRQFESPALSVRLRRAGGPYAYAIEVRDHTGALPQLPLRQPPAAVSTTAPTRPARTMGPSMAPVVVLAALAGLLVLAGMLVRLRLRAGQQSDGDPQGNARP